MLTILNYNPNLTRIQPTNPVSITVIAIARTTRKNLSVTVTARLLVMLARDIVSRSQVSTAPDDSILADLVKLQDIGLEQEAEIVSQLVSMIMVDFIV